MKRQIPIILAAVIILWLMPSCTTPQQPKNEETMTTELIPLDVQQEFAKNGFTWFTENLILCSGDTTESNAMTIGWGSIGNYLGHERPAVTVYVAPARYTWQFMERHPRFTVMQFDDPEVAKYMGSHSGRDGDKAAALGLHVAYTENGTPYYEEAECVIECKKIYSDAFDPANFKDEIPLNFYDGFEAGYHSFYIGKVVKALKK